MNIIALSDSWGSHFGGISTLNHEFCRALAAVNGVNVICILPYVENEKTEEDDVTLIGLYSKEGNVFNEHWPDIASKKLVKYGFQIKDIHFCIGHDVITGNQAIVFRSIYDHVKVILISHQAYQLYTTVKGNDGTAANKKNAEQLRLYKQADMLFCVGPLLFDHFSDAHELSDLRSAGKIIEFIPGLPNIDPSRAGRRKNFSMMTMGRFGPSEADLKGINLVNKGFATAYKEAKLLFGPNPILTIFGLSKDEKIKEIQTIDLISTANEIAEDYFALNPSEYIFDRDSLLNYVRNSSCLAMLSLHEGFGLVGWEAIACEIPLILSKNSGLYMLLEKTNLEHLVTSVDIHHNSSDILEVKEKLKEIAKEWDIKKIKAIELLQNLKKTYTWTRVIEKLLSCVEEVFNDDRKITQGIRLLSAASAKNSLRAVEAFYGALKNKKIDLAWEYLSDDFKNRGIWKEFKDFEVGYSNFQGLKNLRIYESISGISELEYHVIYDDIREVPIEPLIEDKVRFYTVAQKDLFIEKITELENKLVQMGGSAQLYQDMNLSQFFHTGIQDYLMFKMDLFHRIPRAQRALQDIPRYYRCICCYDGDTWKIDRILPIRYSSRS